MVGVLSGFNVLLSLFFSKMIMYIIIVFNKNIFKQDIRKLTI